MFNLYAKTAEVHKLIDQINQKKGLKLKIESDYCWENNGELCIFIREQN